MKRDRKQAEEKLRMLAEEWHTTFDSISDLASTHDKDFKITKANKALVHFANMRLEELLGKTCYEVIHGTKEPLPNCPHAKVMKTKRPVTKEFFDTNLGMHLEVSVSPILDKQGDIVSTVHIVKDITKRKQAEEKARQLQQELILASRLATVGQMAAGIAHEINNPLTGVIGYSQLLMKTDIPADVRGRVHLICEGAQRIDSIVKRMLTFAHQQKPKRALVNINGVIKNTLEMLAYEMGSSAIKLTTELDPDLPRTIADAGQLQQVFLNIILNAQTEMVTAHGRGNLLVKTERIDGAIRVSIKDDGPGIARKDLGKIFDPFFTTREVGRGAGLGLSVCHGIVTGHGGKIYAESKFGKGATLFVELPIVISPKS